MTKFRFRRTQFEQHTILDSHERVVGHVRLKPNAIWWKPAGASSWFGVDIRGFARYMEQRGMPKHRKPAKPGNTSDEN